MKLNLIPMSFNWPRLTGTGWPVPFLFLFLAGVAGAEPTRFLLSTEGSGRATAYLESPKIVTFAGRTHVAWLDSEDGGFRVRVRSRGNENGEWSPTWTIGEARNNHGGPALTIDGEGYLHVLYYSHHHPFRYRRSVRPNDASAWTDYVEFGTDLTYPALLCAADGTLLLTARRSYEDRPWELEMWEKPPGKAWKRRGALLASRHGGYAQFAGSLAWGPDHKTLHLGTRIYETPGDPAAVPLTTIGYLKSKDGGRSWMRADGTEVSVPATASTVEVIASGRGVESRVLNAGSIGVDASGRPALPYSIRVQDTSQAYLARPRSGGGWRHLHLNPSLPPALREWALFMHGGISFGSTGEAVLLGTAMQLEVDSVDWGDPSTEVVRFFSVGEGNRFRAEVIGDPDPATPRWMPNVERPTGFNEVPAFPSFIYTDGERGQNLEDQLDNRVWWVAGEGP